MGVINQRRLRVQWIQTALWERHRIRTLRRTLADFAPGGSAQLDSVTGDLTVDGAPPRARSALLRFQHQTLLTCRN